MPNLSDRIFATKLIGFQLKAVVIIIIITMLMLLLITSFKIEENTVVICLLINITPPSYNKDKIQL